jgi:hypothetical protein
VEECLLQRLDAEDSGDNSVDVAENLVAADVEEEEDEEEDGGP